MAGNTVQLDKRTGLSQGSEVRACWMPGGEVPESLNTGHPVIDEQHRQLAACIAAVRRICVHFHDGQDCTSCASKTRRQCESDLVSLLGDLLGFVVIHFQQEDRIMRDALAHEVDRATCEAHIEDHADISSKIEQIVASLDDRRTIILLRELDVLLQRWMSNHVALHDLLVAPLLPRQIG